MEPPGSRPVATSEFRSAGADAGFRRECGWFTGTAHCSGFDNRETDLASPFQPQAYARALC
jgi:hypothetical protein